LRLRGAATSSFARFTSNRDADPLAIEIGQGDLARGSLQRTSYARPGKLFTGSSTLIAREVGVLTDARTATESWTP
jgi:mRNA interferase MazF